MLLRNVLGDVATAPLRCVHRYTRLAAAVIIMLQVLIIITYKTQGAKNDEPPFESTREK
jgi:hypothetical protein